MSENSPLTEEPLQTVEWQHPDSPSTALIMAISEASGADPIEMEPLYNVVDPDALDELFTPHGPQQAGNDVNVKFEYQGYRIVINAHGKGYVYEQGADTEIAPTPTNAQND